MPSLRTHHLTVAVADRVLLEDVTLHLEPGWTGLVGPNGTGKSTLLEVLAGLRSPAHGHVERLPGDARVVLVPQHLELTDALRVFAAADDALAHRWRKRLTVTDLDAWEHSSAGERKRWQLASVLWAEPDVLLLDEPTNHLDVASREVMLHALARFTGVGLVVAHDRAFLDALTTRTLRLTSNRCDSFPLPYSSARETWLDAEAARRGDAARLERELARLEAASRRSAVAHEATTRQRSAGARMKSLRDSDARGLFANFRAERAQGHLANSTRQLEAHRARVEEEREALEVVFLDEVKLSLPGAPCRAPTVARLEAGEVMTPDASRVLFTLESPRVIRRDARLALVGPNGRGKTTVLQRIAAAATVPASRLVTLPQELTEPHLEHDSKRLERLEPQLKGRALQWVAALGVSVDGLRHRHRRSAGEARVLHLALGLVEAEDSTPWLVLLDEPTNHLAIDLIERLEHALSTLPCAMVLVSHDTKLVEAVATEVWRL